MAGRGTDIQLGGNVRFRLMSWAIEKAKAGGGAYDALVPSREDKRDVDDDLKQWIDERLISADKISTPHFEWVRDRVNAGDPPPESEVEQRERQVRADTTASDAPFREFAARWMAVPPEKWAEDIDALVQELTRVSEPLAHFVERNLREWTQAVAAGKLSPADLAKNVGLVRKGIVELNDECNKALDDILTARKRALMAGGLYVLGTERHESRRIDNQLRGRSGRQGDPGHSKFFLSLEDDLMRIFGTDKLDTMLQRLGLKENEAIVHSWINKALEKAQQKVEARNFDIRKNLLKFDNVMNDQRKVIFEQRVDWMKEDVGAEIVTDMRHSAVDELVAKHVPANAYPEQWDVKGLKEELARVLNLDLPVDEWAKEEGIAEEELTTRVVRRADEHMAAKVAQWGPDVMRYVEKSILLQTLDHLWREHLVTLEHLRQVIGLRGYGQRDPLNEYKAESFNLFETMGINLREAVTAQLMRVEIRTAPPPEPPPQTLPFMQAHKIDPATGEDEMALARAGAETLARHGITAQAQAQVTAERDANNPASWGKVGRNEACPCGSGKKYKHCHGRYA
jgi:preprotein translocase subunit SecA